MNLIYTIPGLIALFYIIGKIIYDRFYFFRSHFIHPPVIAGILMLLLGPSGAEILPLEFQKGISEWPSYLVVLLFAGLILGEKNTHGVQGKNEIPEIILQGNYVWFMALGQIAVGIIIYFLLSPTGLSPLFAHIIEIGWVGGYGAASTMVSLSDKFGSREVGDLSIFSATVGLLWGGLSGMFLAGKLSPGYASKGNTGGGDSSGKIPEYEEENLQDANPESLILSLTGMFLVVIVSFTAREVLAVFFNFTETFIPAFQNWQKFILDLPLFFFALLCALLIRKIASVKKGPGNLNPLSFMISRPVIDESAKLTLFVLELLIITAIAGMDLKSAGHNFIIFAFFMVGAALWTTAVFLIFAKRMLPDGYWFELGIINYGMSTGITALGLMLLRSVPGGMNSKAIKIYGMAAPLSAPFIGGGIITFLLPELTFRGYAGFELAGLLLAMFLIFLFSMNIKRRIRRQNIPNT